MRGTTQPRKFARSEQCRRQVSIPACARLRKQGGGLNHRNSQAVMRAPTLPPLPRLGKPWRLFPGRQRAATFMWLRALRSHRMSKPNNRFWGLMKERVWLICSVSLVLLSPGMTHAQVTIDVAKITCRQLLIGRMLPTSSMALWFGGYYNGKRGATLIDAGAVKANAKKVEDYCGLHQDETVMSAVERLFGIK